MKNRIMAAIAALGIIGAGVAMFAAFESYVLEINAHLEPVLSVNPHGQWDLGTIYPEVDYAVNINVGLSDSALADPNFVSVNYTLNCWDPSAASGKLSLCKDIVTSVDGTLIPAIVDNKFRGSFDLGGNVKDTINIDIFAPDCLGKTQKDETPPGNVVNCDPNGDGINEGVDMGAEISIEVTNVSQAVKPVVDKQGNCTAPTSGQTVSCVD